MRRLLVALGVLAVVGALPVSSMVSAQEVGVGSVLDVGTEARYRAALDFLSTDTSGTGTINITADFAITGTQDPAYTNVSQPLTIHGNHHTIDGGSNRRILNSTSHATLTVDDLVMVRGRADSSTGQGGAIRAQGNVTLERTLVIANFADTAGGAIYAAGDVTIVDSTISGNYGEAGGAIYAESAQGARVRVTRSTFNDNFGDRAGAIYVAGGVDILNSTFNRNFAAQGPGGALLIDAPPNGVSSIRYTTFANNIATGPGGTLFSGDDAGDPSEIDVGGTVISGNPQAQCVLLANTVIFATYSFEASGDSCGFTGPDRPPTGSAQLGALQYNGGSTETILPAATSPLVNAIPAESCLPGVDEDQRGVSRPQGDGCDIGSVELAQNSPPTGGGNPGGGDDHEGNGPTGGRPDAGGTGADTGGTPSSGQAPAAEGTEAPKVTPKFTG